MIKCCRMTRDMLSDAFSLLSNFLSQDEYYLESSAAYGDAGNAALFDALEMFIAQPSLGFVWLAYESEQEAALPDPEVDEAVGVCVVSYAISTSLGAIVAKLDDVFVTFSKRGRGIGSLMLQWLRRELQTMQVGRIDISVHTNNRKARRFYEKLGFEALNEERLAYLVPDAN